MHGWTAQLAHICHKDRAICDRQTRRKREGLTTRGVTDGGRGRATRGVTDRKREGNKGLVGSL